MDASGVSVQESSRSSFAEEDDPWQAAAESFVRECLRTNSDNPTSDSDDSSDSSLTHSQGGMSLEGRGRPGRVEASARDMEKVALEEEAAFGPPEEEGRSSSDEEEEEEGEHHQQGISPEPTCREVDEEDDADDEEEEGEERYSLGDTRETAHASFQERRGVLSVYRFINGLVIRDIGSAEMRKDLGKWLKSAKVVLMVCIRVMIKTGTRSPPEWVPFFREKLSEIERFHMRMFQPILIHGIPQSMVSPAISLFVVECLLMTVEYPREVLDGEGALDTEDLIEEDRLYTHHGILAKKGSFFDYTASDVYETLERLKEHWCRLPFSNDLPSILAAVERRIAYFVTFARPRSEMNDPKISEPFQHDHGSEERAIQAFRKQVMERDSAEFEDIDKELSALSEQTYRVRSHHNLPGGSTLPGEGLLQSNPSNQGERQLQQIATRVCALQRKKEILESKAEDDACKAFEEHTHKCFRYVFSIRALRQLSLTIFNMKDSIRAHETVGSATMNIDAVAILLRSCKSWTKFVRERANIMDAIFAVSTESLGENTMDKIRDDVYASFMQPGDKERFFLHASEHEMGSSYRVMQSLHPDELNDIHPLTMRPDFILENQPVNSIVTACHVICVFSHFMYHQYNHLDFRSRYVIPSDMINQDYVQKFITGKSSDALLPGMSQGGGFLQEKHMEPMIVQLFRGYHVIYAGVLYRCKDIYEAIMLWIYLVVEDLDCRLSCGTDISDIYYLMFRRAAAIRHEKRGMELRLHGRVAMSKECKRFLEKPGDWVNCLKTLRHDGLAPYRRKQNEHVPPCIWVLFQKERREDMEQTRTYFAKEMNGSKAGELYYKSCAYNLPQGMYRFLPKRSEILACSHENLHQAWREKIVLSEYRGRESTTYKRVHDIPHDIKKRHLVKPF